MKAFAALFFVTAVVALPKNTAPQPSTGGLNQPCTGGTGGTCDTGLYCSAATCVCYVGTVTNAKGTGCAACPKGYYCPTPGGSPVECPAGTFGSATGYTAESDCTQCPAGTASQTTGATSQNTCKDCSANTYSQSGWAVCQACPDGTFNAAKGSGTCFQYCGPGYGYTGTTCQPCTAGYYSDVQKNDGPCSQCAPGTFQSGSYGTSCSPCGINEYNPYYAQPSCFDCPSGTSAKGKATTCKTKSSKLRL